MIGSLGKHLLYFDAGAKEAIWAEFKFECTITSPTFWDHSAYAIE